MPLTREPRHHLWFENEYLRIFEAIIVPEDITFFHIHAADSVMVVTHGGKIRNEPLDKPAWIGQAATGELVYRNWQAHPLVHRIGNLDSHPVVALDCEIKIPRPGQFPAPDRSGAAAYVSEIDNDRAHVWRLKLGTGQSVPPITQSGPGLRIVLGGDRFRETVQGAPDRDVGVQQGSWAWQPAGTTRAITNTGSAPLELVEFEVK